MPLVDAKRAGAIAMFGEKYTDEVWVVEVPGVSMELCGGTRVSNTAEIRSFKVISEQGIASGVRRIEAVAGEAFIEYINARDSYMKQLCTILKLQVIAAAEYISKFMAHAKAEDVTTRVENLLEELRSVSNEVPAARAKAATVKASIVSNKALAIGTFSYRVLVENMDDMDADSLKSAAECLVDLLKDPAAVVLGSCPCPGDGKVSLVATFSLGIAESGKFIGNIAKMCVGGGGGRPDFAQAGGRKPKNLSCALVKA